MTFKNIITKKIIAREFLIALGVIVISGMINLTCHCQIKSLRSKLESIENDLTINTPQLNKVNLYDLFISKNIITSKTSKEKFTNATLEQQEKIYELGVKEGLFMNTDFKTFKTAWYNLNMNSILKLNKKKSDINTRIKNLEYLGGFDDFVGALTFLLIMLAYPLRGLIYSVRWSIRTLKETT